MLLDLAIPEVVHLFWLGLSDFLAPVRMPLFFAISGFFVGKYLTAPWSTVARRRVLAGYYLYLLWYIIHSLFFLLDPPLVTNMPSNLNEYALGIFWGYSSLWYLYALPLYFVASKIFVRWRVQALIGAAILSILSSTAMMPQLGNGSSVVGNLVFFMLAAYCPQILFRVAANVRLHFWKTLVLFTFSSCVMSLITYTVLDNHIEATMIYLFMGAADLFLGILGIIVGVKIFKGLADRNERIAQFFGYLGRNTLPIYVLHLLVLALLNFLLMESYMPIFLSVIYPFVAIIIVVGVCLGFYQLLLVLRLNWLFKMPNSGKSTRSRWADEPRHT